MCNPVSTRHPDYVLAKGEHHGYQWEVTHNGMAYRCGYVRIPVEHPWHGQHYSSIPATTHGGLTFTEADLQCGRGDVDNAWWIGFDCAHLMLGDQPDPALPGFSVAFARMVAPTAILGQRAAIRSTDYVIGECQALCEQAHAAARDD
jgi:hypothetical protein